MVYWGIMCRHRFLSPKRKVIDVKLVSYYSGEFSSPDCKYTINLSAAWVPQSLNLWPLSITCILISALGMNSRLSCTVLYQISSTLPISIELVQMQCARTPYVGMWTYALLPTREIQLSANCPRACTFEIVAFLELEYLFDNWLDNMILTCAMCLF